MQYGMPFPTLRRWINWWLDVTICRSPLTALIFSTIFVVGYAVYLISFFFTGSLDNGGVGIIFLLLLCTIPFFIGMVIYSFFRALWLWLRLKVCNGGANRLRAGSLDNLPCRESRTFLQR